MFLILRARGDDARDVHGSGTDLPEPRRSVSFPSTFPGDDPHPGLGTRPAEPADRETQGTEQSLDAANVQAPPKASLASVSRPSSSSPVSEAAAPAPAALLPSRSFWSRDQQPALFLH